MTLTVIQRRRIIILPQCRANFQQRLYRVGRMGTSKPTEERKDKDTTEEICFSKKSADAQADDSKDKEIPMHINFLTNPEDERK